MILSIILLASVSGGASWQLVDELCQTTNIAKLFPRGNWCSPSVPRCQWIGVGCNADLQNTYVFLENIPLNVKVPNSVGAPGPFVVSIVLKNCSLHGNFPQAFSADSMSWIDLSDNSLEGNLPWNVLARMFTIVDVSRNKLSGQAELTKYNMPFMSDLVLTDNQFYEDLTPLSGGTWPRFEKFEVANNLFFGRAPYFPNADTYDISGNYFSDIEDGSGDYLLEFCDANKNPFRKEPPQWLKSHYEQCNYDYSPTNKLYFMKDIEQLTAGPTKTTSGNSVVAGTQK